MHRLPKPSGLLLQELVAAYVRPDGTTGLRVRESAGALQVGAETLALVLPQPETLSLASLFTLAARLDIAPGQIVANVFDQVCQQRPQNQPSAAAQAQRQPSRPVSPDAAAGSEPGPQLKRPRAQTRKAKPAPATELAPVSNPQPDTEADDAAQKIAYADATLLQRSLALASVQHELSDYFPTLSLAAWANALDVLAPELWLEATPEPQVTLEEPALQQLLQQLARSKELPRLDRTIHTPISGLMAQRLVYLSCWAVKALAEIERNPSGYGPLVRELVFMLANGHSHELTVLAAFGKNIATLNTNGTPRPEHELPGSPRVLARILRLQWPNGGPGGFAMPPMPPSGPQTSPPGMA